MKNLKKIAALVIVLAMALSSVAFGAVYTDVAEDASYNEAVTVMSALGLLKGYEDGTFGPDKTITRAEFATVIVRALGMEDAAAGAVANTAFTDVTASHWAAGYVKIANQKGIIAGYGDGTFGPEDEVTYEQAVKMIVCALGYGIKFAEDANAYPSAYLSQANTSGITIGAAGKIGEKATRATVAKLVYNALDVNLMEQTGFGTEKEFKEVAKTLLSNNLKIAKMEATVAALHFDPEQADEVNINVSKIAGIYCDAMECNVNPSTGAYIVSSLNGDYKYAETVVPEEVKGYSCVSYIDVSGEAEDWTILAMVPKSGKNSTLTLTATQTEGGLLNIAGGEAKYYKNSVDTDVAPTTIKINTSAAVYVNKNAAAVATGSIAAFEAAWAAATTYPSYTLIDNDGDNKYDIIYATSYNAGIVDEISARTNKLTLTDPSDTLKLDPESETYIYTIKDAEGKALDFADIKIGDVVNWTESIDGSYKFYDVVVTNTKVEGTVGEIVDSYMAGSPAVEYVTEAEIGGTIYNVNALRMKSGTAGVFTLDYTGKIIAVDEAAGNANFGYVFGSYADTTGLDTELKAVIYTTAGEFVTYSFAKKVVYDSTEADNQVVATTGLTAFQTATDKELVVFYTNTANEITKMYTSATMATNTKYSYNTDSAASFKPSTEAFDGDFITDATVFFANKNDITLTNIAEAKTNYALSSKAMLNDEDTYEMTAIVDEDDNIIVTMVFGAVAKVDNASAPMYITKTGKSVDEDGNDTITVTGWVDGELTTIVVTDDTNIYSRKYNTSATTYANAYGTVAKTDIVAGAVIQFAGEKEATAVRVLLKATDVAAGSVTNASAITYAEDDKEGFLYIGTVDEIIKNKNIVFANTDEIDFSAGVAAGLVKVQSGTIKNVFGADYSFTDVETDSDPYGGSVPSNGDKLVIYKLDGESIGALIIDTDYDFE